MKNNKEEDSLVIGEIYHIFNKSIAEFKIFNSESEFLRMRKQLSYYQIQGKPRSFSQFDKRPREPFIVNQDEKLVEIIAYCFMPTHIHLILKQLKDKGISIFMNNILNSYSRYFNLRHRRKGPLWEGRFRRVRVETDEQLLHLTRYIHLNPVTAYLINEPIEWSSSSYKEYICDDPLMNRLCKYEGILDIDMEFYKKFVEDRISCQRDLAKIKHISFE